MSRKSKIRKTFDVFSSGGTDEEKKARHVMGGLISMGALLAGGIFQVAWMTATPRMLGDRDMGLYGPMIALFLMLANIVGLGIPQTIMSFVSHHYEDNFEEALKFASDGLGLVVRIVLVAVLAVCVAAIALGASGVVSWENAVMAIVLIAAVATTVVFWSVNAVMNGFQRLDLVSFGNIVFPIGVFVGTIVLIWAAQAVWGYDSQWDVTLGMGGQFVGSFFALLIALYVLNKMGLIRVRDFFSLGASNGLYVKILRFGGVTAVAMICVNVVQQMTPVLVRWIGIKLMLFGDTPELCEAAIGRFSTGMIFGMAPMLIAGVAIALAPAVSEAKSQNRPDLVQHYYTSALKQSFTVIGVILIVFIAYAGNIIEAMDGPQFPASLMHLPGALSVAGGSGAALLFVLVHLFIGLKRPDTASIILGAVLVALIVSTLLLCVYFRDVNWAYGGFIFSTWAGCAALFVAAKIHFGLHVPARVYLRPVAAGAPGLLTASLLPRTLPFIALGIVLMLAVYFFISWLFERGDKNAEPAT